MKSVKLHELTIDGLVDRFAELGAAQDKAELYGEISKYNKLFKEMTAVDLQLRARARPRGEARVAQASRPSKYASSDAGRNN